MKFTLSWLKQHLDTDASLQTICDKLTALGLEVEDVRDPSEALKPFIIAHVLTAEQHPQADRLKVTTVDTGTEKLQVVCGAPNCRAGLKVVLARPGDVMPDRGEALKKGVIRGVESQGMLCASDELCIGDDHSGIIELPLDAPVGANFADYAGLNDPVIEINLTPNRPDCAGVRGIARDLAAAGLGTLKALDETPVAGEGATPVVTLDFDDAHRHTCPHFVSCLIRNVKNGASPQWLQQKLQAIGQRPISALVDMTNFMTYDRARPLHVFDAKKIKGNLRVHLSQGGEMFAALNGKDYTLQPGMVVISDDTGIISLAGIMGGSTTACDENTTDVLIEAAYFDPVITAQTGRTLQVTSDARYRFERGIDTQSAVAGIEAATRMVVELCGTPETKIAQVAVAGAAPDHTRTIALDPMLCKKRTGVDVPVAEQTRILTTLGFVVADGAALNVTPPSWRPDVEGAADLVEEIVRVVGYDAVPATSLQRIEATTPVALDDEDKRLVRMRRALAGQGLMESVTWSFMSRDLAAKFTPANDALVLQNPISSDLDVMRPTIIANLAQAARRNADRGFADVALFEIGPVFKDTTPEGQVLVATTLRAGQSPRHWAASVRFADAFDAKADAMAALASIGAPVASLQATTDAPAWYHPGRSGCLRLGPNLLASFGELHPALVDAFGLTGSVAVAEIYPANIPQSRTGTAKPLLKLEALQPVVRDFAFVVDRAVTAAKLIKAARDAEKNLIRDVSVFDVYEGEHVAAGKKSVALAVTMQPVEKTLTDAEIDAIAAKVTASVEKATGAVLRG